jgi:hypothetical protein
LRSVATFPYPSGAVRAPTINLTTNATTVKTIARAIVAKPAR